MNVVRLFLFVRDKRERERVRSQSVVRPSRREERKSKLYRREMNDF